MATRAPLGLGFSRFSLLRSVVQESGDFRYRIQPFRKLTITDITTKRKEFMKRELIGFSMEEMFSVASDVSNYYKFVPYVKKSHVHSKKDNQFKADLIVGFPPLHEAYTSLITLEAPHHVHTVCNDGRLFNYLLNEWKFSPGPKDIAQSCVVDFKVYFEFRSLLYSNLANLFFEMVCDQMEHAFSTEAKRRYGDPSIKSLVLSLHRS